MFYDRDVVRVDNAIGLVTESGSTTEIEVAFLDGSPRQKIQQSTCVLVDRALSLGDIVYLQNLAGTVVSVNLTVTLRHVLPNKSLPAPLDSSLFRHAHVLEEGMLVSHNATSWIGQISSIVDQIAIVFPSTGYICIPKTLDQIVSCDGIHEESMFAFARFHSCQKVKSATDSNLREAIWLVGSYFPGCFDEIALVVGVRPDQVFINWLLSRTHDTLQASADPPSELNSIDDISALSSCFEHLSFQIGDFVMFRDESVAKSTLGITDPISMEKAPYYFILQITSTSTTADIQWQDATISRNISAVSLKPSLHTSDQNYWPTDFVQKAGRVGMVLSSNSRDRTVRLRWYNSKVTQFEGLESEYSAYEIQLHSEIQFRIGNRVMLTHALSENNSDWFGEVLQIQTHDGLIQVRFFGSKNIASCAPSSLVVYHYDSDDGKSAYTTGTSAYTQSTNGMEYLRDEDSDESQTDEDSWMTDDSEEMAVMCESDGADAMADSVEALRKTHLSSPSPKQSSMGSIESDWVNFKSIETAPMDHFFSTALNQNYSHTFHKRLKKEYSMLATSLPPSILVRVYDDRIDLLRTMIIGPDSTPYEGGLFLFDISLPHDYPASPPKVHFHSHTFGMGKLNPNLYEDGKVCLSLLGTWRSDHPSESWSPSKSTLLQLLISINALILTRTPYFNEPGTENLLGTVEGESNSKMYTERVYLIVLRTIEAMVRKCVDGGCISGFENEVRYHFVEIGWLRRVLERANAIATKSIFDDGRSDPSVSTTDDFFSFTVSAGCLKLLKVQINSLDALKFKYYAM